MLVIPDLLLVAATSVVTSALTWRLLFKNKPITQPDRQPPPEVSFLFGKGQLIDCSKAGDRLLKDLATDVSDWQDFRVLVQKRFPDFPEAPPPHLHELPFIFNSDVIGPLSRLTIAQKGERIKVSLADNQNENINLVNLFKNDRANSRDIPAKLALELAPYPTWQTSFDGTVLWANPAYMQLSEAVLPAAEPMTQPPIGERDNDLPTIFPNIGTDPSDRRSRVALTVADDNDTLWYDVTTQHAHDSCVHYAADVNVVVQAEIAQRDFVQTLTKTFAQLATGLAIFDRKRELTLFNPALTDLTNLPAPFLSGRPSLTSFFDRLRDAQMMPEPKDYRNWREELAALTSEASSGCYLETWNLPSGLTYRVTGRPHPNGALAFLFEDISAEVSLTRRFRTELELNHAVLDRLDNPLAVFSDGGMLHFCNQAYGRLWNVDLNRNFAEVTVLDCLRHWFEKSDCEFDIAEMTARLSAQGPEAITGCGFTLPGDTRLVAFSQRVAGGATMVHFASPGSVPTRLALAHSA